MTKSRWVIANVDLHVSMKIRGRPLWASGGSSQAACMYFLSLTSLYVLILNYRRFELCLEQWRQFHCDMRDLGQWLNQAEKIIQDCHNSAGRLDVNKARARQLVGEAQNGRVNCCLRICFKRPLSWCCHSNKCNLTKGGSRNSLVPFSTMNISIHYCYWIKGTQPIWWRNDNGLFGLKPSNKMTQVCS